MHQNSLPQDIRDFLSEFIDSVSQLEILLMCSSEPQTAFSPEDISKNLRTHPMTAQKQLQSLVDKGLLASISDHKFIFRPKELELKDLIYKLASSYKIKPVAVVTFIYDKPTDKLKGFADAFKFKKD